MRVSECAPGSAPRSIPPTGPTWSRAVQSQTDAAEPRRRPGSIVNGWRVETGNCDEAASADKTGLAIVEAGRAGLFSGKAAARRPAVVRIGVAEINEHRGKAVAESGCNKPSNQPTDLLAFARRLPARCGCAPSARRSAALWTLVVASAMAITRAISLFERPRVRSKSTPRWRFANS